MNIEEYKEKYPKALEWCIDSCNEVGNYKKDKTFLGYKYKITECRSPTKQELEVQLTYLINNIKEPIWTLCEDLLNHWYERFAIINQHKEIYKLSVGEVEFTLHYVYHMSRSLSISPNITETNEEDLLLSACMTKVINYETNTVYREKLMKILCGGENDQV